MRNPALGVELVAFLKSFEGSTAGFSHEGIAWSLWLPEVNAGDRPVTPATQLFFPVFLRGHDQAFALRFFYDCSTGKVRYYTGAIPEEVSDLPEFQNAVSEIFRHSLPVEPIRQRNLRKGTRQTAPSRRSRVASLAEPVEIPRRMPEPPRPERKAEAVLAPPAVKEVAVARVPGSAAELTLAVPPPAAPTPAQVVPTVKRIRLELGEHARHVLMAAIVTFGILVLAGIGGLIYLEKTQDPGIRHHQMQLEELRLRNRTP